jgi:hypothetical protein
MHVEFIVPEIGGRIGLRSAKLRKYRIDQEVKLLS